MSPEDAIAGEQRESGESASDARTGRRPSGAVSAAPGGASPVPPAYEDPFRALGGTASAPAAASALVAAPDAPLARGGRLVENGVEAASDFIGGFFEPQE